MLLSIENSPPADPHPCQVVPEKSTGDPSSSSLDRRHNQNPNPIPNFSIRDYVFTARKKDIKKSWPFSVENLQLCAKHGIKDPLPPFQTLEAVKEGSSKRRIEAINNGKDNRIDNALQTNLKLPVHSTKCKSRTENDPPSTSTRVHQSAVESIEADHTVLELLARKTEATNKFASKKCRLVVKFGSIPSEDIVSNSAGISESMASKICPVCKTFSSSSNTTLNAHIDQCLAENSKPEMASDSKPARHKIKARRIRLMSDIYTTAKHCTLEELNRRNCTSWASLAVNLTSSDADIVDDPTDEADNQRVSLLRSYKTNDDDEAPVYVDANGTKVGILSKLDGATTSKADRVIGPSKSLKVGKDSRFPSSKKKSRHGKKRHKYLKLVPQSTKLFSQKVHSSQTSSGVEGYHGEGSSKRGIGRKVKQSRPVQILGTANQWVKRNILVKDHKLTVLSVNTVASPENSRKNAKACGEVPVMDKKRKISNVGSTEVPLLSSKRDTDRFNKISSSERIDPKTRAPERRSNSISHSISKKKFYRNEADYSEVSPCGNSKSPTIGSQALSSRSLKTLSLGKKASIRHHSMSKAESNQLNKRSKHLKAREDEDFAELEPGIDQQRNFMYYDSDDQRDDNMVSDDTCLGTSDVFSGEGVVASKSSQMILQYHNQDNGESEDFSVNPDFEDDDSDNDVEDGDGADDTETDDDDVDFTYDEEDVLEDFDGPEPVEGSVSEFLDSKFHKPRNHLRTRFESRETSGDFTRVSSEGDAFIRPMEPSLFCAQEIYSSAHEVGVGAAEQDAHMAMELDSATNEGSSYPEVEPIPIPGPPGSFLPSPRDMMGASDNFLGNSSLSDSPVQSHEDRRDFVNRNLSASPVSLASTISNSIADRSDHAKYSSVQENTSLSFLNNANSDPPPDSAASSQQTSIGGERSFEEDRFSINKKAFGFDQPCCCQRKERLSSQGFLTLNFRESELLRRRTMTAAVGAPVIERQTGVDPNSRPNNSHQRSELFDLSAHQVSKSVPLVKPFAEIISPDSGKIHPDSSVHNAASPSPSPILRLMGKNLMVMNGDDSVSANNLIPPPLSASPAMDPPSYLNRDINGLHQYLPNRSSLRYGHGSCDAMGTLYPRNGFESGISSSGLTQNRIQVSTGMLQSQKMSAFSVPAFQNVEFKAVPLKHGSGSPARLGCIPEGSGLGYCSNKEHSGTLGFKNFW